MGLFFRRKKNKLNSNEKQVELAVNKEAKSSSNQSLDMVELIKNEQTAIENPFTNKTESNLSVAKRFGTKYASAKGQQLASSKVVDVRSYVKSVKEVVTTEEKEKTEFEKELEKLEQDKLPEIKPSESPKSFFDDLLKSIEEDSDEDDFINNDEVDLLKPAVPEVEKKPKTNSKRVVKKKRSVDIDIISGDFGGADII